MTVYDILLDQLYFVSNKQMPQHNSNEITVINVDSQFIYDGYNTDFGPLNLADMHKFCR